LSLSMMFQHKVLVQSILTCQIQTGGNYEKTK
jgi:hypothetical protein